MSDELVERVALKLRSLPIRDMTDPGGELDELRLREAARAALSALPSHKLLREALDALEPFVEIAKRADQGWTSGNEYGDHTMIAPPIRAGHFRRARAAAEKLRAALEVG